MLSLLELTQSRKCKMLQCCDEYQILKIAVLINPSSSNIERNPALQKIEDLVTYVAWKCVNSRKHFSICETNLMWAVKVKNEERRRVT